jgi:hypothetical protein
MKKYVLILFSLLAMLPGLFASEQLTRKIQDFHTLDVFGNIKITLIKADTAKVVLQSDLYELAKVTTVVEKGRLKVRSNGMGDKNEIIATIYFTSIVDLKLDGGANVVQSDTLKSDNLDIRAAKGSLMRAPIQVKKLTLIVLHGSEVRLLGKADEVDATANSGGVLDMEKATVKVADLLATSGGKLYMYVTEKINARAKLGGVITYKGNPKTESVDPSSGGKIVKG